MNGIFYFKKNISRKVEKHREELSLCLALAPLLFQERVGEVIDADCIYSFLKLPDSL
jgi:hypothetical protein